MSVTATWLLAFCGSQFLLAVVAAFSEHFKRDFFQEILRGEFVSRTRAAPQRCSTRERSCVSDARGGRPCISGSQPSPQRGGHFRRLKFLLLQMCSTWLFSVSGVVFLAFPRAIWPSAVCALAPQAYLSVGSTPCGIWSRFLVAF
ncbi:putative transmembrane protein [Toxoplasma gondii TgCatPRC2]|uniref:Putative transmembrane protein n=1 Tax=Toxoplasma gondii TgCatPRC2 TaxID=1130821 RepID=A0A151HHC5_TOXGO|nr:putative transmembrane protein [Toxoplasma gondii TgCatPRC2]